MTRAHVHWVRTLSPSVEDLHLNENNANRQRLIRTGIWSAEFGFKYKGPGARGGTVHDWTAMTSCNRLSYCSGYGQVLVTRPKTHSLMTSHSSKRAQGRYCGCFWTVSQTRCMCNEVPWAAAHSSAFVSNWYVTGLKAREAAAVWVGGGEWQPVFPTKLQHLD